MNLRASFKMIGYILFVEAFFLLLPALYDHWDVNKASNSFVAPIIFCLLLGFLFVNIYPDSHTYSPKEGLFVVVIGWIFVSAIGAIPYVISHTVPTYIDGLFEATSGFTGTGATVILDINHTDKGILLWRSITHWLGGMGILVFTVALLPKIGFEGFKVFRAESPGPSVGKLEPRIADTAKALYKMYLIFTILLILLLRIAGMTFYDAVNHSMATVATGGFSPHAESISFFENNLAIKWILILFMFICSTNFSFHSLILKGQIKEACKDEEFRFFVFMVTLGTLLIFFNLVHDGRPADVKTLTSSSFNIITFTSTTGFTETNYSLWPTFSKIILVIFLIIGGSAGSTAGGVKMIRILILLKIIRKEILHILYPSAVMPIKINGQRVDDRMQGGIIAFVSCYILLFTVGMGVVSLFDYDFLTSLTSVLTCFSNVGPGLNGVDPTHTFAFFPPFLKVVFTFLMLLGRLEIFPIIALITPTSWSYKHRL